MLTEGYNFQLSQMNEFWKSAVRHEAYDQQHYNVHLKFAEGINLMLLRKENNKSHATMTTTTRREETIGGDTNLWSRS